MRDISQRPFGIRDDHAHQSLLQNQVFGGLDLHLKLERVASAIISVILMGSFSRKATNAHLRKDLAFKGLARPSFSQFRALGSAIWRANQESAREHDCNMGFGKKYALQMLGIWRDHLAEPLMGGPFAFSEPRICTCNSNSFPGVPHLFLCFCLFKKDKNLCSTCAGDGIFSKSLKSWQVPAKIQEEDC